jgi:hypothetical protein
MDKVARMVVLVASGPGIAAPTYDRFELERGALEEKDAADMDGLVVAADFFRLREPVPLARTYDGAHKSFITVTMADGRSHSFAFAGAPTEPSVQKLVDFVLSRAEGHPV